MKNKTPRIRIDDTRKEVFVRGREISLSPKEYAMLEVLFRTNRVMSREQLLLCVWKVSANIDTRTVDQHMCRLRRSLGDAASAIKTVSGFGYRYDGNKD